MEPGGCLSTAEMDRIVGAGPDADTAAVDRHLAVCPACRERFRQLRPSRLEELGALLMSAQDPGCPSEADLAAYADGQLDSAQAAAIELHLEECAVCLSDLQAIREVTAEAAALDPEAILAELDAAARAKEPIVETVVSVKSQRERKRPLGSIPGWLAAPFQVPSFRYSLVGATSIATAVLGYVIGSGSVTGPTLQNVPVASQPEQDYQARATKAEEELTRAKRQIAHLTDPARARQAGQATGTKETPTRTEEKRAEDVWTREQAPSWSDNGGKSGGYPIQSTRETAVRIVNRSVAEFAQTIAAVLPPMYRTRGRKTGLSPARTWVTSDQPLLRCALPGAHEGTEYVASIESASGSVLTIRQTGPVLQVRPDFHLPRGRKLAWSVSAQVGEEMPTSSGEFGVLTEDEVRRVEAVAKRVSGLERARVYRRAGLLLDATAVLEKIPDSSPQYKGATRELDAIDALLKPRDAAAPDAEAGTTAEKPAPDETP